MGIYRAFLLDANDHIIACEQLLASVDQDAAEQARAILSERNYYACCEVWRGARKICRIAPAGRPGAVSL